MRLKFSIILLSCLSVSACATIDLDEIAASNQATKIATLDVNVVQRAAFKLYAAFSSKGIVAKDSRKRVQSAASVLLKGLEEKDVTDLSLSYAAGISNVDTVLADIRLASRHVEQTTKAAEVFLAIGSAETSMRSELNSLEKALLASHQAENVFEDALANFGVTITSNELKNYSIFVRELSDITNAFGDRVRDAQSQNNAPIQIN